jgi:hypothetical protein
LLLALLAGGCTHVYTHTFQAEPVETLSPQEVRDVLAKFKVYLASRGMRQVIEPGMNADYATFDISSGNIALPRVPFQEYLRLSYSSERGFTLTITRAVTHPANFTNQYLTDFRLAVEQIIADVTSKNVRLRVIGDHP